MFAELERVVNTDLNFPNVPISSPGLLGNGTCLVRELFYQADLDVGISIIKEYTMMLKYGQKADR